MNNNLRVDAAGRAFLTQQEGEVLHAYQDSGNRWTIGVGHLLTTGSLSTVLTHEQSQDLLTKDLARFEAAVNRLVTVPLTQHQFNALVSFTFNLGEASLQRSSLLKLINGGGNADEDAEMFTHCFTIWCNVNGQPNAGIRARRQREAAYFLTH